MKAFSLDTTGIDEHTALVSGDAGRGGTFPVFPLFMPRYGKRHDFRESRTVHFRQLIRERHIYPGGSPASFSIAGCPFAL